MWPRIDVAAELTRPGRLAEVIKSLRDLDLRGFLDPLREQLKRERGALLRGATSLPPIVREVVEFAGQVFDAVRDALALASFVVAMRAANTPDVRSAEAQLAKQLQRLAALVFEAQARVGPAQCEAVAGLGGGASLWGASSGIEATKRIAWDVCAVVRGLPSVFLAESRRSASRRQKREAGALDRKDCAILRAIAGSADGSKEVSRAATKLLRREVSEQAVRHRKARLIDLGYLQPKDRIYAVTKKGKDKVSALEKGDPA